MTSSNEIAEDGWDRKASLDEMKLFAAHIMLSESALQLTGNLILGAMELGLQCFG